jgi:DNA-binding response OmpR family regulator
MEPRDKVQKRVLVVEDEAVIGRVCRKVLTGHGFAVDIVPNGVMAINNLNNRYYNLCILDLRIPGIDGIELYKYLHNNYRELSRNVVFTTGDLTVGQISGLLKRSGRVCLQKPFTPRELLLAVELAMN